MQVMGLEERRRIRKTLTVASLKERLKVSRDLEKKQCEKRTKVKKEGLQPQGGHTSSGRLEQT
tara:strand:+ start:162 stop:350 length:189 start_codon:yes stop_codon:yes gene_type:complete